MSAAHSHFRLPPTTVNRREVFFPILERDMNFAFKSSIKPNGFLNSVKRVRQIHLQKAAERKFSVGDNIGGFSRLSKLTGCDDPAVLYRIGDCYERGLGAVQNFTDAVRWYEAAAKLDMVEAMVKLGDIYLTGRS